MTHQTDTEGGAHLSPCRTYRYRLWRWWDPDAGYAAFVMLNPSTADETTDDPTIRRCMGFAKAWGCGGLLVVNLFALRATDPAELFHHADPVGPENDMHIERTAENARIVVAAWGNHGWYKSRDLIVRRMLPTAQHLGLTMKGQPKHPLYIRADTQPSQWSAAAMDAPAPAASEGTPRDGGREGE